jgi:signal peptidase I
MKPITMKQFFLIALITVIMTATTTAMLQPTFYWVTGESMEPALYDGDIILTVRGNYEVGDIIVFRISPNRLISHRVYFKKGVHYTAKGDNNEEPDLYKIHQDDIVGKIIYIRRNKNER